jgi:hypothetical protein
MAATRKAIGVTLRIHTAWAEQTCKPGAGLRCRELWLPNWPVKEVKAAAMEE